MSVEGFVWCLINKIIKTTLWIISQLNYAKFSWIAIVIEICYLCPWCFRSLCLLCSFLEESFTIFLMSLIHEFSGSLCCNFDVCWLMSSGFVAVKNYRAAERPISYRMYTKLQNVPVEHFYYENEMFLEYEWNVYENGWNGWWIIKWIMK